MELVRAGYTKEEISAMVTPAPPAADPASPAADPAPPAADPAPPAADQAPPAADQAPPAADPAPPAADRLKVIEQAIIKLTQAVQASNINNSGGSAGTELRAEDALASLITKK